MNRKHSISQTTKESQKQAQNEINKQIKAFLKLSPAEHEEYLQRYAEYENAMIELLYEDLR